MARVRVKGGGAVPKALFKFFDPVYETFGLHTPWPRSGIGKKMRSNCIEWNGAVVPTCSRLQQMIGLCMTARFILIGWNLKKSDTGGVWRWNRSLARITYHLKNNTPYISAREHWWRLHYDYIHHHMGIAGPQACDAEFTHLEEEEPSEV